MDEDGLVRRRARGAARGRAAAEARSTSSPSTRTRPAARCRSSAAQALVELCRRHGVLILEDVAYRELACGAGRCRRCGRSRPTSWCRPARSPRSSSRACGSAGRPGPAEVVGAARGREADDRPVRGRARPADASRSTAAPATSSAQLPRARELYASHWRALDARAARAHARRRARGREPTGGFLTWLDAARGPRRDGAARGGDSRPASPTCRARRSTPSERGRDELRLSFSALGAEDLAEAGRRLAIALQSSAAASAR